MDISEIISNWFRAHNLMPPPPVIRAGGVVILPKNITHWLTLEQIQDLEKFVEDQGLELRLTEGGKNV